MKSNRLVDNTYVDKSPIHGFGVYADKDIEKGELVMQCVIPEDRLTKNTYAMRNYRFAWREELENGEYEDDFVPLGNACVINCNDENTKANMKWLCIYKERIIEAWSTTRIDKGSEILWSYFSDNQYKPDPIS